MTLSTYGIAAFGIEATTEVNNALAKAIVDTFDNKETGAIALRTILDGLYQKAEAITDGRSKGFRMFTAEGTHKLESDALTRKVFDILQAAGWHYNLKLTDDALLPA
ncbi:MAG: hypothetical protein ACU84J_01915 [Gammaproteobacteria bacterium]